MNEAISLQGFLRLERFDSTGKLVEVRDRVNLITTMGKNGLADQVLDSPTLLKPLYMAIGTGTPGVSALGAEISRVPYTSKTRSGAIVTLIANWAAGQGTGSITEAGNFDANTGGNMWTSASFAAVAKAATDTLQVTWTLTVG